MTAKDLAKCDCTALLAGLTYILRRLCRYRGNAMTDGIEMDECIALARWMDAYEPGPDPVVERTFRTTPAYEIPNTIEANRCVSKS